MNEELKLRYPDWPVGRVAHAEDCKSLYIGSIPVPVSKIHSLPHLLFRLSSAVEQSAVNRLVACSNQAAGANKKTSLWEVFFIGYNCLAENNDCLFVSGSRIKTTAAPVVFTARDVALPRYKCSRSTIYPLQSK